MPYVNVGTENSGAIELYYEDHGSGPPVVLIHGYPLSGKAWDKQVPVLLDMGCRVITYDRRGFGKSSQPVTGYDYDTFAADLNALMEKLDLREAASVACIPTWETDFRGDLPKIDVPMLVIQGDADRVLPFDKTGKRLPDLIKNAQLVVIEGGPHAIAWTHADQVNRALYQFLS